MAQAATAPTVIAGDAIVGYFEVHVRRDDRWLIECTAQVAEDALSEAQDLARRSDVRGVKVVHERYNPQTDQSAGRVVFDFAKPEHKRPHGLPRPAAVPRPQPAEPQTVPAAAGATPASPPPPRSSPSMSGAAFRRRPVAAPVPWTAFAWASLALAVAATLLFLVLAVGH